MPHLVITLDEMKRYLKVPATVTVDDDVITSLIESAKEQAEGILCHNYTTVDEAGVVTYLTIPSSVKMACMRMVQSWYSHRDDETETSGLGDLSVNRGEVPWDAERMLWPHKRWAGF